MSSNASLFCYPGLATEPPESDLLSAYDRRHMSTYAALILADDDGDSWQSMAADILKLNVEGHEEDAKRCCEAHLERARWFLETGYHQLFIRREPKQ